MRAECKCCNILQKAQDQEPRELVPLPITTGLKDLPILVCEYCDGPALELSREVYEDWVSEDE